MLDVIDLCYERDERPLFKGLSLRVKPGEALQITGANGSGKTSLLKILAGLLFPTQGEVRWQDQAILSHRAQYYSHLLYIGHLAGVTSLLNPRENLHYYQPEASLADISNALAQLGLGDYIDTPCHQLSAGQQRRVALARLLLSTARLWVLDEPLTAIDQQGIRLIEQFIDSHLSTGGSVILTSHQALSLGTITPQEVTLA